jgi:hypothetical protein
MVSVKGEVELAKRPKYSAFRLEHAKHHFYALVTGGDNELKDTSIFR